MGSATLHLFLVYMLLLEDVTFASNVFGTCVLVIISSYVVFSKSVLNLILYQLFVNSIIILFQLQTLCM